MYKYNYITNNFIHLKYAHLDYIRSILQAFIRMIDVAWSSIAQKFILKKMIAQHELP